jgi:hypothetical protein
VKPYGLVNDISHNLQHLNNCKQLSKLFLVAPNLKLLHVGGCKNMASMSLRCPQLTQLLANLCFRSVTPRLVLPGSNWILFSLSSYSQPCCLPCRWSGVMSEHWVCPRLQHINLFGARHLDNASLAVILNQSPGLRQINLSESVKNPRSGISVGPHLMLPKASLELRIPPRPTQMDAMPSPRSISQRGILSSRRST